MKLNILSDLHLTRGALAKPENDADIVILAGDVARPNQAISWASDLGKPVLYVPGNHEFYGNTIAGTLGALEGLCAGTRVRVLVNKEVTIGNVRFLGTTLWTDFMLFGASEKRDAAIQAAIAGMYDFSKIFVEDTGRRLFTPADSESLFQIQAEWLQKKLAERHAGPTVVITHHAPSRKSIHSRFSSSLLNACFVSDAEHLLDGRRVRLWVHGHTHDSFDYLLNGTRVVCNPRGYADGTRNENPQFDANFSVRVDGD